VNCAADSEAQHKLNASLNSRAVQSRLYAEYAVLCLPKACAFNTASTESRE
jgi:hypothetical protein